MRHAWNKGFTKATHPSIQKLSDTLKRKKIDNFRLWRAQMRDRGLIKTTSRPLRRNADLAELIGVVLGDGSITAFPRTECLRIVANANNAGFIRRYARLVDRVFSKEPHVAKRSSSNAINITIYECCISSRLGIPAGAKGSLRDVLPAWISKEKGLLIAYLRGLYEAEGSYCVHEKTYTHKLLFSNKNPALLDAVFRSLRKLGFHPHRSPDKIQISRKQEVQNLRHLLRFRRYNR